jgi:O-antigen/teichoic acid export membrane protein
MNAINTTMYTIILKNHARRSSENTQIKIGLISVSILIFIYYVPLMIFSNKIISFLISASFASSTYKVTSIMSLASIFYLYGNVFENALSAKGCARYIFYVYFISIVGYFLALGLLYKVYGIYGFVYAYIIMCAVLCTGFIYMHHVLALSKTKILGGNVETI